MKNAMKKIMSLMLVALLLVSALPLAASAASVDPFAGFSAAPEAPAEENEEQGQQKSDTFDLLDQFDDADKDAEEEEEEEESNPLAGFGAGFAGGVGGGAYTGGFPSITIKDEAQATVKSGSIVVGNGPNTLDIITMLKSLLGDNWTKDYTFVEAYGNDGTADKTAVWTTNPNYVFKEQEETIEIIVKKTVETWIDVQLIQTTTDGTEHVFDTKTLTQVRTLNFNTLYDLIPPTDTNYAYRLATAGITYMGKKLHSNQTAVPVVAGNNVVKIYLDVIDVNSNAPVVYPVGSTGTGNGTTGNGTTNNNTNNNNSNNNNSNNNNNNNNNNTNNGSSGNNNSYNKFPYNVYLNIYKDTMIGAPDKTINITSGAAADGYVSLEEAKSIVLNYYTAKNSRGIAFDGLYLAKGTWVADYIYDNTASDPVYVQELRQRETVYVNVMISNANAAGTSTSVADSSNPKTGDAIFAPIAVLGVSATALAAVMFFYNKKRMAQ